MSFDHQGFADARHRSPAPLARSRFQSLGAWFLAQVESKSILAGAEKARSVCDEKKILVFWRKGDLTSVWE